MIAFVAFVVFVFLFCYGCARQYRVRQSQRNLAKAAELLLWREVLEIAKRNRRSTRPQLTRTKKPLGGFRFLLQPHRRCLMFDTL
jgi:hypothetical protein